MPARFNPHFPAALFRLAVAGAVTTSAACTTVTAVGGGEGGQFYVAASTSYLLFPGPSYVLECFHNEQLSVTCVRVLDGQALGVLAPGSGVPKASFPMSAMPFGPPSSGSGDPWSAEPARVELTETPLGPAKMAFEEFSLACSGLTYAALAAQTVTVCGAQLCDLSAAELRQVLRPKDYASGEWVATAAWTGTDELGDFVRLDVHPTSVGDQGSTDSYVLLRSRGGTLRIVVQGGKWYTRR